MILSKLLLSQFKSIQKDKVLALNNLKHLDIFKQQVSNKKENFKRIGNNFKISNNSNKKPSYKETINQKWLVFIVVKKEETKIKSPKNLLERKQRTQFLKHKFREVVLEWDTNNIKLWIKVLECF